MVTGVIRTSVIGLTRGLESSNADCPQACPAPHQGEDTTTTAKRTERLRIHSPPGKLDGRGSHDRLRYAQLYPRCVNQPQKSGERPLKARRAGGSGQSITPAPRGRRSDAPE